MEVRDAEYISPQMTDRQIPYRSAQRQPFSTTSYSSGNISENLAPSAVLNPSIILTKPLPRAGGSSIPVKTEKQQRVDNINTQPLRDLSALQDLSANETARIPSSRETTGLPYTESSSTPANPSIKPSNGASSKSNATVGGSQSTTAQDLPPTPSSGQTLYAKPVVGHPGFVYPPGVVEELKNMLDVRGSPVGQKMRDPRTGNTFLVP